MSRGEIIHRGCNERCEVVFRTQQIFSSGILYITSTLKYYIGHTRSMPHAVEYALCACKS